jgi:hypothetical protein
MLHLGIFVVLVSFGVNVIPRRGFINKKTKYGQPLNKRVASPDTGRFSLNISFSLFWHVTLFEKVAFSRDTRKLYINMCKTTVYMLTLWESQKSYFHICSNEEDFQVLDTKSFFVIYKTLVRTHLDYASSVCALYKMKYIEKIESVQKRVTKQFTLVWFTCWWTILFELILELNLNPVSFINPKNELASLS